MIATIITTMIISKPPTVGWEGEVIVCEDVVVGGAVGVVEDVCVVVEVVGVYVVVVVGE